MEKELENNIDIVIMWVDGNDSKWREKKQLWQEKHGIKSNREERYREWGMLPYLFRGIEEYAPWVNNVYFITDDQKPDWLNISHEKLKVIDHKDFIPNQYLPTFNSHTIELNIHRIEGLADHFILFNDDMYLVNPTRKNDFFENGIPKDTAILSTVYPKLDTPLSKFVYNDLEIINDKFSKKKVIKDARKKWYSYKNGIQTLRTILLSPWPYFTGFFEPHLCVPYLKDTFDEVWGEYEAILDKTSASKFREEHNVNQWLMRYWQFGKNRFLPRSINFGKVENLTDLKSAEKALKTINNRKYKVVCINDTESVDDFDRMKDILIRGFEEKLSNKSKYER